MMKIKSIVYLKPHIRHNMFGLEQRTPYIIENMMGRKLKLEGIDKEIPSSMFLVKEYEFTYNIYSEWIYKDKDPALKISPNLFAKMAGLKYSNEKLRVVHREGSSDEDHIIHLFDDLTQTQIDLDAFAHEIYAAAKIAGLNKK